MSVQIAAILFMCLWILCTYMLAKAEYVSGVMEILCFAYMGFFMALIAVIVTAGMVGIAGVALGVWL